MKHWKLVVVCWAFLLAACGGGGGNGGASSFGAGSGSGSDNGTGAGTTTPAAPYSLSVEIQRGGASTTSINSTETVQAVGTVIAKTGEPVAGVVVTFSENGPGIVTFAPTTATALTDASGRAFVDLSASAPSRTGATTVLAAATVSSTEIKSSKSIQINAGPAVVGTPAVPAALNFISSNPSGAAIVVKGSGGNGRSESAILTFRVVDATGAPINAAKVDFSLNPDSGGATIQPSSGISNSEGLVTVTVASGASPASIVVKASASAVAGVTSQSDTLIVSNAVAIPEGFEIAAEKYNLDGHRIGDSTSVTAYVRDRFGNLVADGVAVSFQTDYGAIGSSTLGGCTTVNGRCSVQFYVQAPRTNSIATVVATVRVGSSSPPLSDSIRINMAGANAGPYLALDSKRNPLQKISLSSCKETIELLLTDGTGHAPAAGTTIDASFASTGVKVLVKAGSPVLDQLDNAFPPVPFGIEVDLTDAALSTPCSTATSRLPKPSNAFVRLDFKTPGGIIYTQRLEIDYPQ